MIRVLPQVKSHVSQGGTDNKGDSLAEDLAALAKEKQIIFDAIKNEKNLLHNSGKTKRSLSTGKVGLNAIVLISFGNININFLAETNQAS